MSKLLNDLTSVGEKLETHNRYIFPYLNLRSRRLEVVGTRKNGHARRRHSRGEGAPAWKAP